MNFTAKTVLSGGGSLVITITHEKVKVYDINPGDYVYMDIVKIVKKRVSLKYFAKCGPIGT